MFYTQQEIVYRLYAAVVLYNNQSKFGQFKSVKALSDGIDSNDVEDYWENEL